MPVTFVYLVTSSSSIDYVVDLLSVYYTVYCRLFQLVKYEPISVKISRHVLELTLNKAVHEVRTPPEICANTTLGNLK